MINGCRHQTLNTTQKMKNKHNNYFCFHSVFIYSWIFPVRVLNLFHYNLLSWNGKVRSNRFLWIRRASYPKMWPRVIFNAKNSMFSQIISANCLRFTLVTDEIILPLKMKTNLILVQLHILEIFFYFPGLNPKWLKLIIWGNEPN